jgi:hypothetical protein
MPTELLYFIVSFSYSSFYFLGFFFFFERTFVKIQSINQYIFSWDGCLQNYFILLLRSLILLFIFSDSFSSLREPYLVHNIFVGIYAYRNIIFLSCVIINQSINYFILSYIFVTKSFPV